tara:strand:- start:606 stop:1028 length:423 start_codon:yes stop_codon:yes gene_type:complete
MGSGYSMPRQYNETYAHRGNQVSRNIPGTFQSQVYQITPNEKRIFLAALKELDFLTLYDNSYHTDFKRRDTLIRLDFLFTQIKSVNMYKQLLSSEEIDIPEMPAPSYSKEDRKDDIYDQNYVDYLKSCVIFLNDFCNAFR